MAGPAPSGSTRTPRRAPAGPSAASTRAVHCVDQGHLAANGTDYSLSATSRDSDSDWTRTTQIFETVKNSWRLTG